MYEYEELDEYSTLIIQPGRTRIGSSPSSFHASPNYSWGNGEYLISTGHGFNRIGNSVWLGTVVDSVIFGRVVASLIKLNPNVEISNYWPDGPPINGNIVWTSLIGDSITVFSAAQKDNNGSRGTITEVSRRVISPTTGRELLLIEATATSSPGNSGGPVRRNSVEAILEL